MGRVSLKSFTKLHGNKNDKCKEWLNSFNNGVKDMGKWTKYRNC